MVAIRAPCAAATTRRPARLPRPKSPPGARRRSNPRRIGNDGRRPRWGTGRQGSARLGSPARASGGHDPRPIARARRRTTRRGAKPRAPLPLPPVPPCEPHDRQSRAAGGTVPGTARPSVAESGGPPSRRSNRRQRKTRRAEVHAAASRVRVSDSGSARAESSAITRVQPLSMATTAVVAMPLRPRSSQKRLGALTGRPSSTGAIAHTPWRGAGPSQTVRSAGRNDTTTSSARRIPANVARPEEMDDRSVWRMPRAGPNTAPVEPLV